MIPELLGAVVASYVLLVGGLAVFQRGMIYSPGRERIDPADVGLDRMVPVPVRTEDGWIVTGWYAPPSDSRAPTIVFFHGNGGAPADRARKAKAFLEAGYGVYMVGYRGYGGNPGRPSERGLFADGRAVMAWLTSRGLPASRLVLYGESLGSGVATKMALENPDIAALVLEAPFTSLTQMAPPYLLPGTADLLVRDKFDNLSRIGQVQAPILIIHGDRDALVPVAMGQALLAAAQSIKEAAIIKGAGHNDVWDEGGENAVFDFLTRRLAT